MERVSAHPSSLHLVITDVVMPGLSGRELAAKLTARFSGLRVLYTSGHTNATTVATGIDPAAPFLPKPFLPADLVAKVRDVLGGAGVTV
jgi:two-component system cell cycle sensor histidine kinase/response regulator CckA